MSTDTRNPFAASRMWMPVVPFLVFWAIAFAMYEIGPLVNPRLAPETYAYLLSAVGALVVGYLLAVKTKNQVRASQSRRETRRAQVLVRWTAPVSAIGTAGLVLDRLLSGAGSVSKTIFETQSVRDFEAQNTTIITTISVAPYSLSFVAIACFFYCKGAHVQISRVTTWSIYTQIALVAFNAFLTANRGSFFWIATYWLFYWLFVRSNTIRSWLRTMRPRERIVYLLFVIVGVVYSIFIARNRNSDDYLSWLARSARENARFDTGNYEEATVGTFVGLLTYGTHQFEYVDAFLERAEPLAFRPILLIGGRTLDQVRRVDPSFGRGAEDLAHRWIFEAGLSPYGWPSVFGWPLAMFGSIGAVAFFGLLGWTFGAVVKRYVTRREVGMLIVAFCLFQAMNMSFAWIGGDTTHNVGYATGLFMAVSSGKRETGCQHKV
ncbi:oligosaccharide repeat unit polymerase, partial [bacterium]|nr:oligosaccharide repeat unit polymerase [bacterium]